MTSKIKYIFFGIIILGLIAIAFNLIFGYGTIDFVYRERIEGGLWYYRYDTVGYLNNIQTSITDVAVLKLDMPTRQWDTTAWDLTNWANILGNNLAVMFDYWVMLINISLYPLRVGAYFIKQILALIGINVLNPNPNSNISWLVEFVNNLVTISIPYV